jgi:hypothetical protein
MNARRHQMSATTIGLDGLRREDAALVGAKAANSVSSSAPGSTCRGDLSRRARPMWMR